MEASVALSKAATPDSTAAAARETFSPPPTIGNSSCHSPVPKIFAGLGVGLAITLGLIAFVVIIHACFWRLCRQVGGGEEGCRSRHAVNVDAGDNTPPFEEILAIMAGDVKPTFLATPASTTNF
ncbi:hypothetical protein AAHA92_03362 [Salvia divinorum]|uniref:Uncharacterized protein n=1 Tax=Salvia divinorum TaxID=28513 RepID=A0ABD1IJJ9_SALDI